MHTGGPPVLSFLSVIMSPSFQSSSAEASVLSSSSLVVAPSTALARRAPSACSPPQPPLVAKYRVSCRAGTTRFVYGKEGKREKAAFTNWDGSNLDPDSVSRHYHSLNRAGFRDNAHAKGFF